MHCTTVREGAECLFMTAKGCSYKEGTCHEVVAECEGCDRRTEFSSNWYCMASPEPAIKWKGGRCNLATHVTTETGVTEAKINPLKASKRASKKK